MAFDYESIKTDAAEELIAEFGKTAILTQPGTTTGPEYDPTPGTPVDYNITIIELVIKLSQIDGTLIQEGDRLFLVSTRGASTPAMNNTLMVNGVTLQIISIKPLEPGPVTMLWKIQCRK